MSQSGYSSSGVSGSFDDPVFQYKQVVQQLGLNGLISQYSLCSDNMPRYYFLPYVRFLAICILCNSIT